MQMIFFTDNSFYQCPIPRAGQVREALFRDENIGFILYLSDDVQFSNVEERIIRLEPREALIWLNEAAEDGGTFWS